MINQLIVLEYDKFGNSWLLLVKSHLVQGMVHCETLRQSLVNQQTKELCLFNEENGNKLQLLLTRREQEVLTLIAQGLDNTSISEKLFIILENHALSYEWMFQASSQIFYSTFIIPGHCPGLYCFSLSGLFF
jgi:hypothetical protein